MPGTIDLRPAAVRLTKAEVGDSGHITATVTVDIHNAGASPAGEVPVRFQRDGVPAGEASVPAILAGGMGQASVIWPNLAPGVYQVRVDVDPGAGIVIVIPSTTA